LLDMLVAPVTVTSLKLTVPESSPAALLGGIPAAMIPVIVRSTKCILFIAFWNEYPLESGKLKAESGL
jgi:hypothetical protein